MLRLALLFLVIALIAAIMGFGNIAWASAEIARVVFFVFLVLFVVSLLGGLMNRPTDVPDTPLLGPKSVASRINWVLTSSHSTGTAVRSTGMTAPSCMTGPLSR